MLLPVTEFRIVMWAGYYVLPSLVLLLLMLLLFEGGFGRILLAWFLSALGILAWKLLYWLLIRAAVGRLMAAAVSAFCNHAA